MYCVKSRALALVMVLTLVGIANSANIVSVVETGGDNEATDTIPAKWSGQTWQVTVAAEPLLDSVVGANYTAGLFADLSPAFVDRAHRYMSDAALPIPAYLIGKEYILSGNDNRDNATYKLDVTIADPSTVYMLIDNRLSDADGATPPTFDATHMQWIVDQGWAATANGLNRGLNVNLPDELAFDEGADGTVNQYYSVYQKKFLAGTFSLLQAENAGQNMYGVVIAPDGEIVVGDVNGDEVVDLLDFGVIRDHFRTGAAPAEGDLNFDGTVDFDDFQIWKTAFGGGAPANVPEPTTSAIALIACAVMAGRSAWRKVRGAASLLGLLGLLAGPVSGATIVSVVETGGDNEATDTIPAQWSGQTWQVTVAGEPLLDSVVGANFTAGLFGHFAPSFVDRVHRYSDVTASNTLPIPGYLVGSEYLLSGNDNRDNATYRLDVTVNAAATAYILIDNRLSDTSNANPPTFDATHMQWIIDQGWAPTAHGLNRAGDPALPDEVAFDEGANDTIEQYYSVYQKAFPAGTFSLFQADNAGQNMYGVVVKPGAAAVVGDVNGDLFVDIQDFDIIRLNFRTGTTPEQGDLDFSGLVDLSDFKIWKNAFSGPLPVGVPEPSAFMLLGMGLAAAALVRVRRSAAHAVVMGAMLLSANASQAQSTIVFVPTGDGDWNALASWIDPVSQQNFIPGDNYPDEVPGINNGGTAFLNVAALHSVGGVLIAEGAGSSGRLDIRNGGSLNVVAAATPAANGSVTVGQAGTGRLTLAGNGSLTARNLSLGGASGSTLEASGTAKIALSGSAVLARNTRLVGPNVDFDVAGNLSVNGVYQPSISPAGASIVNVTGSASVGGRLDVNFDGVTPAFGNSWQLINAATATGRFSSITSNVALPRGLVYDQAVNAGGSGDVSVRVVNRLILSVDRGTGATIIENVAGGPVNFDGYGINSPLGSLDASDWSSLDKKNLGSWLEAPPTNTDLGELAPFAGSTLPVGQSLSLGTPFKFTPTAFGQSGDDLTFDYSTASGETIRGLVEYSGPHNTLVLVVDPDTGDAVIQNQSSFSAAINGYTIGSASGSLQFANGAWLSLDDQGLSSWEEANPSAEFLNELNPLGSSLFSSRMLVDLGTPFKVTGKRDLTFEIHLVSGETMLGAVEYGEPISVGQPGDTDNDGDVDITDLNGVRNNFGNTGQVGSTAGDAFPFDGKVDISDLNAVRNNFGAAPGAQSVPEPASLGLVLTAVALVFAARQRRRD
ncbi:MAG: PEP-CTERM sorting domain-containing protein [Planctomycetia bacterium]|nr:PEP-CTERM sorting domain-containing protein [Planctomycetia bacterium]